MAKQGRLARKAAVVVVAAALAGVLENMPAWAAGPCPTAALAPLGLAPIPDECGTPNYLVRFKGYEWWTSYQYYGGGSYFPGGEYFYNGGLRTAFAPRNVFVDREGLHLQIANQDLGAGEVPAGAEAVSMFKSNGAEANLGYGDYLVTARIVTASSWADLDPNAVFGAFTYERLNRGITGSAANPHREIDQEITRWGWDGTGTCPYTGEAVPMCNGNAQFTLQPADALRRNIHRYTIDEGVRTITLVMRWHGAKQPVSFSQYNGKFTFADLPATASHEWTSSPIQDEFIPATRCERFHVNFWNGNDAAGVEPNPPPSILPQEVVMTNFVFRPFQ